MDEAFSEEELEGMSGIQATRNRVTEVIVATRPCAICSTSRAAREGARAVVAAPRTSPTNSNNGSLSAPATDSSSRRPTFPAHLRISPPGDPELQRRGLYHREYDGLTLRENLGLGLPQPRWWK
jgi:hypothetical protein